MSHRKLSLRSGNRRGMTLVEVVVAALLAMILSLGLLQMHLTARVMMKKTRIQMEATNVLQSYLEQVKNSSYAGLADTAYNDITISSAGTIIADDDITGDITIDVTDNGNDTKTIVGTAQWSERSAGAIVARQITLSTLVSEP